MSTTHISRCEEECAERLTGPGKELLSFLVLGEALLPLVNFRTDTLAQKHLQYQHSYFDGCILQLLHLVLKVLSGICSFAAALSDFCLSRLRRCGCAAHGGTWRSPGEAMSVSRHTLGLDILASSVSLAELSLL